VPGFKKIDRRFEFIDRRVEQGDQRFASLERHLISLSDKVDSIARFLKDTADTRWKPLSAHEERLKDLVAAERARREFE
jgi:hypothetical protein